MLVAEVVVGNWTKGSTGLVEPPYLNSEDGIEQHVIIAHNHRDGGRDGVGGGVGTRRASAMTRLSTILIIQRSSVSSGTFKHSHAMSLSTTYARLHILHPPKASRLPLGLWTKSSTQRNQTLNRKAPKVRKEKTLERDLLVPAQCKKWPC
eukprot:6123656-Amphidinium_carterae.1